MYCMQTTHIAFFIFGNIVLTNRKYQNTRVYIVGRTQFEARYEDLLAKLRFTLQTIVSSVCKHYFSTLIQLQKRLLVLFIYIQH